MAQPLARLRMDLEFMPSPVEDRPGLLIRDSFHYSESVLIIPPRLIPCLQCFDGEQTDLDLRAELVRVTGSLDVSSAQQQILEGLERAGFLENETFARMKEAREREFAESPVREATHAGSAYPDDEHEVRTTLDEYLAGGGPVCDGNLIGIAAPHVSPFGGWETYRAAYSALRPEHRHRTFVVLGTSHYGEPEKFGLTRKSFATPYGETRTDEGLLDLLASQPAVKMEDYCHSVEHSIEFQVLFLQHLYGPDIRVLPILCGGFGRSVYEGGLPEDDDGVRRFFGQLGEIAAKEQDRLLWVLGIDMAHIGVRYGDRRPAIANQGAMQEVERRDRLRIDEMNRGDALGFWNLVQQNRDDLKWCGSAPAYTFLKAVPVARGALRGYQQWSIDHQSVVSFAAVAFTKN